MSARNTTDSYGAVSKTFHWLMAVIVAGMIFLGFYMGGVENLTDKLKLYGLHKSTGVAVLLLVILRIVWHLYSRRPRLDGSMKRWEKLAAHTLHTFLYLAMIGMPMSGWLMSSAGGRPVSFFGLFTLPDLIAPNDTLRGFFGAMHYFLAFALTAMIIGHVGAALKHHFINKDATLRRMLPLLLIAALFTLPAAAQAPRKWEVIKEQSSLTFTGKVMGQEFTGIFSDFTADISFDPDNLTTARVTADIDIQSLDSKDKARDDTAKGRDFFDAGNFPKARFESSVFKKTGKDSYEASGNLKIKEASLPLTLPFTLAFTPDDSGKKMAEMRGTALIDRSKFQLGQGEWADESVIANKISLTIHITAMTGNY